MKKVIMKIGVCFALLLSLISVFTGNIYAYSEGVTVGYNTTGLSEAKYQATFVFDASHLEKEVENVQLEGGFQFIKKSEDHLYQDNLASNAGITWYSAYEYQEGMYPTGGCGNKDRTDLKYDGSCILYDMEKDDTLYSVTLPLPATEYYYGYYVTYQDGSSEVIQDPANPSKSNPLNQHDASWSYFYVGSKEDALEGQEYIYPSQKTGKQEYQSYQAFDGTTNQIGVYLPAGYENGKDYKTIYLAHGNGGNETEWCQLGSASSIVENLIAENKLADSIVVTLNNSHFSGTGFDVASNKILADDVVNNVIPFIESHYKVSTDPNDRSYAGLSAGGVAASTVMELAPDSFGAFGIISAAVQVDDSLFTDELVSKLKTKKIYISAGTVDFGLINSFFKASVVDFFMPQLDKYGIGYTFEKQNGAHDWNTWRGAFSRFASEILWNPEYVTYHLTMVDTLNQGDNLTIKTDIPVSKYQTCIIDDQEVTPTVSTENDFVTLTLASSKLALGKHTITVQATNGKTSGTFEVIEKVMVKNETSQAVKTGDDSYGQWYLLLCLLSFGFFKKKAFIR